MCCLFGLLDYRHTLSNKRKNQIMKVLATECEARGTDATGIAYNVHGTLHIYKKAVPAHKLHMVLPPDASVVMGHTRMTTQGSEKQNYNNHPFRGMAEQVPFALAHNGVLYNDDLLKRQYKLPESKIRTDSYVAAQLIEKKKRLDFDSLRFMAEQLEGSFTITVLDAANNLWIAKGDNPLCLMQFPRLGIYLYASTEEILRRALGKLHLQKEQQVHISTDCGELLKLKPDGNIARERFDDSRLFARYRYLYEPISYDASPWDNDYLNEIKEVAASFGYAPDSIDTLAQQGFSPEELEEFLYCGEL